MEHDSQDNRPKVIRDSKGKRPQFYETEGLDQAMSMIMVLANELSVLHDRVDAQERAAKANGFDMAKGIEALILTEPELQEREQWRQDFLERLFYLARKDANEAANAETKSGYDKTIADIAVK